LSLFMAKAMSHAADKPAWLAQMDVRKANT
jgi:hypothetical protein